MMDINCVVAEIYLLQVNNEILIQNMAMDFFNERNTTRKPLSRLVC